MTGTGAAVVLYSRKRGLPQTMVIVTNYYISDIVAHNRVLGADQVLKKSDDLAELWDYFSQPRNSS